MNKIMNVSGPVIVCDGKVLVDKSGEDNFWKFCGGRVKENLGLKENAAYRAKEELGIDINFLDQQPFFMYVLKPGEENIEVILVHFLADFTGDIVMGDDVREWTWLDIKNLPNDIAPNIVPALEYFGLL